MTIPAAKVGIGAQRFFDIFQDVRVAWRLFWNRRVPLWTKLVPALAVAYIVWPLDFLADPILGLGQLDDLTILWLGLKLFISLGLGRAPSQSEASPWEEPSTAESAASTVDTTYRVLS